MKTFYFTLILGILWINTPVFGQSQDTTLREIKLEPAPKKKAWYEQLSFGGYTHFRYNRLLETNPKLKCEQCDRSWGEGGSFFFRRARLKMSGDVHERVYVYMQLDVASNLSAGAAGMNLNYAQIRDLYFDLALDKKKEFRIRPGVSKVPYGFDNLQSSQNRIAFDRSDALNSGVPNERDMGIFFYWAPQKIRERFAHLVKSGLKGSGDYGVFGLGTYSGQSLNKSDLNDNLHVVSRITYPFELKNGQFIETGIYGYSGYWSTKEVRSTNVKGVNDYRDQRIGAHFIVYPQPLGIQAEYTFGRGPEFVRADTSIRLKNLQGGYVQAMYAIKWGKQNINPYTRAQYYKGGKKHETDARHYEVHELEMGIEWQPIPAFELTAAYVISKRTFEDSKLPVNTQKGNLLRLQAQFNY